MPKKTSAKSSPKKTGTTKKTTTAKASSKKTVKTRPTTSSTTSKAKTKKSHAGVGKVTAVVDSVSLDKKRLATQSVDDVLITLDWTEGGSQETHQDTNAAGSTTFNDLSTGISYTVTASKPDYVFSPNPQIATLTTSKPTKTVYFTMSKA
jgi:hypothetical protein